MILSQGAAIATFAFFNLVYASFYFTLDTYFEKDDYKRKSWILTLLSSTGTSISGICSFLILLVYGWEDSLVRSGNIFTELSIIFFMAYLLMDMLIGKLFYPDYITLKTGMAHHTAFLFIAYTVLSNNVSFVLTLCFVEEVPIVFLTASFLNKSYRKDLLYGSLYFLTRVVFHSYLVYNAYIRNVSVWIYGIPTGLVHLYCLSRWVRQQHRLGRFKRLNFLSKSTERKQWGLPLQSRASKQRRRY